MKKITQFLIVAFFMIFLTSCAQHIDVQACVPVTNATYGFWGGLWHGMISGFSFIGSLFDNDIVVWSVDNNGGWYAFGFVLGIGGLASATKTIVAIINSL